MEQEVLVNPQQLSKEEIVEPQSKFKTVVLPLLVILLIIAAGVLTGRILAGKGLLGGAQKLSGGAEVVKKGGEVGIKDVKTFRDTSQGKVELNDNPNVHEGTHKLLRPGGVSQTAYLTSSVVDLNIFVGKCIQVWGETFSAQKAGWFMDVGRVKILDKCPEGI